MYRANQAARFCKSIDSFQPPSLTLCSPSLPLPRWLVVVADGSIHIAIAQRTKMAINVCSRLRELAPAARGGIAQLGTIYLVRSVVVGAVSHLQLLRPFDLFPQRRRRRTEFQINDRHYCSPPAASASFRAGDISARGETVALALGCVKRLY